ncbi:hypothetical protein KGA66_22230 [Actinocrinis puniceicyclus]|uniref:Intracellular septation protein A n=1 Tax=Actinocrinis puniceicyclus TaxID=977794 RepID=A0A8J7WSR1_9ACTN|nr:VC0807 family protein [Actinocrinis puniceicyclus]MBS2965787.1 hypothetical protein [Actinocrinis puniceicyclus]
MTGDEEAAAAHQAQRPAAQDLAAQMAAAQMAAAQMAAREPAARTPPSRRAALLIALWDMAAPAALYYGLRADGISMFAALLAGAALPALSFALQWIRRRHLDALGMFGAGMMLLGVAASLIGGGARLLLARDGWVTAVAGLWFAGSARARRPLVYSSAQPLLEGRFRSDGTPWEVLWADHPAFRRIWRVSTVIWGTAMLGDAAARIVMAYVLPVDAVPALNALLWPITLVALQVVNGAYYEIAGLWRITSGKARSGGEGAVPPPATRPKQ